MGVSEQTSETGGIETVNLIYTNLDEVGNLEYEGMLGDEK